jgi:hypothetical protein
MPAGFRDFWSGMFVPESTVDIVVELLFKSAGVIFRLSARYSTFGKDPEGRTPCFY